MNLKFEVSMEEANLLIAALAKQPFESVAGLITKLQQQAEKQLSSHDKAGSAGDSK